MTRRPGDREPEPPGGRAAERLREFIDQRFPSGVPSPEDVREQDESGRPTKMQLEGLKQTLQELVAAYERLQARLGQLEQIVQELVEARNRTRVGPEKQDKTE